MKLLIMSVYISVFLFHTGVCSGSISSNRPSSFSPHLPQLSDTNNLLSAQNLTTPDSIPPVSVKITHRESTVSRDKYGRTVIIDSTVTEVGYDSDGNVILNKKYNQTRTINDFTAWNSALSETIKTFNESGAEKLVVKQTIKHEYDDLMREVRTTYTTDESGNRGADADEPNYHKVTERVEEVADLDGDGLLDFDDGGNAIGLKVTETITTDKGKSVKHYDENRTYRNGRLLSSHQKGTETAPDPKNDKKNVTSDFESITTYTYNEIGQVAFTETKSWDSTTFKDDNTNVDHFDKSGSYVLQRTIYKYDKYGRLIGRAVQVQVVVKGKVEQNSLTRWKVDGTEGFNDVGEFKKEISDDIKDYKGKDLTPDTDWAYIDSLFPANNGGS